MAEACAWVAQLDSGNLTSSDMVALREWMARSPAHKKEIREIVNLNGQLGVLTELTDPMKVATAQNSKLRKRSWALMSSRPRLVTLCASLLAMVFFAAYVFIETVATPVEIYRTAVGQYQTITLTDGTEVKLNTDKIGRAHV